MPRNDLSLHLRGQQPRAERTREPAALKKNGFYLFIFTYMHTYTHTDIGVGIHTYTHTYIGVGNQAQSASVSQQL